MYRFVHTILFLVEYQILLVEMEGHQLNSGMPCTYASLSGFQRLQ
jgi:hypothetical protein